MYQNVPSNEQCRLKELYDLQILDTSKEERFDRYVKLVSNIFDIPIVLITLIDANRQWFKSCVGTQVNEVPREISFCTHALTSKDILVIKDATLDKRFDKNPMVINEPFIRFYAGAILRGPTGQAVGTLCILDTIKRDFSKIDSDRLIQFSHLVEHELHYNYYLNQMRLKIETSLYYDSVTKLPNRRLAEEKLKQAIMSRQDSNQIIIFSVKIESFNDMLNAYGQKIMEAIVKALAAQLNATFNENNTIAYLENGHFILFMQVENQNCIIEKAQMLIQIFQQSIIVYNKKYVLSCHIGVSVCPLDSNNENELIRMAIHAMDFHDVNSDLLYRTYSKVLNKKLQDYYEIRYQLKQAILEETLEVFYQPKIELATGRICGAEALCRWNHPKNGSISPSVFIPIAELSDLIIQLGNYVLKKVMTQSRTWQSMGISHGRISVNLSAKQLLKQNFIPEIMHIIKENQCQPESIDFEITETSLIDNLCLAGQTIDALRKLGFTISLDDFGTGYASLSYLRHIKIHTLKIDQAFIKEITSNKTDAIIVSSIIMAMQKLNYVTIAEGVETFEQLQLLRSFGCNQIQGYLFSRAVCPEEYTKMLLEDKRLLF